jgi:hypothetical protein
MIHVGNGYDSGINEVLPGFTQATLMRLPIDKPYDSRNRWGQWFVYRDEQGPITKTADIITGLSVQRVSQSDDGKMSRTNVSKSLWLWNGGRLTNCRYGSF